MFNQQWKALGILIFLSFFYSVPSAFAAQEVGTLEIEEGKVLVLRGAETTELEEGDEIPVFAKDTVQTLGESFALLILGNEDNSDQISLDEKTTFVIEEYAASEEPIRGTFSIIGGKVRSLVNQAQGKKDIKLKTSSATLGVKGTDFLTEVPNSSVTQVTTFEGTVAFQNRLGDVMQEVDISGGFSSVVLAGSPPSSPFELSRESLLESSNLLARPAPLTQTESVSSEELVQENIAQASKAQFDQLIEEAARKTGSLIHVEIEF